ncbi:MAG: glycosyltransferase family 39 protein [Chloroflexi bacterium]|nr:glycosyltransferase family 39 protein [Chloroflexota bacterium]
MRQTRFRVALLAILLLAFALRVYLLDAQSSWHDETYCVLIAQQPLSRVITAQTQDIHPPLYFVLLHFWLPLAGSTDWAVRFLSVVFGVLLVAWLYRAGALFFNRQIGLIAALLGAVAPFYVAYAQEIRMYALVALLTLASLTLGYRQLYPDRRSRTGWSWLAYVLVTTAALYAHYFAALVIMAQNLAWLGGLLAWRVGCPRAADGVRPIRPALGRWIATQVLVAVVYLPQLVTAARQLGSYTNPGLQLVSPAEFLRESWQVFNVGLAVDAEWVTPALLVLGAIWIVGLILLIARSWPRHARAAGYLLCCFLVPVALFLIVLLSRPLFHPRFLLVAMPAYTLLLAGALWAWGQRPLWRLVGGLALAVVLTVALLGLTGHYHDERFFKADTRAVAGFLHEHATADDLILVDVEFLFGYYDHGPAPYHYILASDEATPTELSALCQGKRRLYVVRWQEGVGDPKWLVDYLLRKYGQPLGEWDFRGYQVFGYRIPPDPAFQIGDGYEARADTFEGLLRLEAAAYGGAGLNSLNTPAQVSAHSTVVGRTAWVALRWLALAPMSANYKCFVHLRSAAGDQVAGADTLLMNDHRQTTAQMVPNTAFMDYHLLDIPADVEPGIYTLYAGLYDPVADARLSVLNEAGAPAGTEIVIGTIQITGR